MLKQLATVHLRLSISLWSLYEKRSCISVLLTKTQKEQLMGKQPHTENVFGHPTGLRQIGLKPHRDLAHQQGYDQTDLDIQMPPCNLALEKHNVLRSRGHGACFCEISHPVLRYCKNSLPLSGTCPREVFKDHLCRQFPYRTATLCNLGELDPFFIFTSRELFMHITVPMYEKETFVSERTCTLSFAAGVHKCMTHCFF